MPQIIAFSLEHGEAKVLITDREFSATVKAALDICARTSRSSIDYDDPEFTRPGERLGAIEYEELLAEGDPDFAWSPPQDEWDAIALNYTSGTTGDPKGVVYHHRGAYLLALGNILTGGMGQHPVYLWTLPMFHCNGWCFPWSLSIVAGTHVCLRAVRAKPMYDAIADHGVTHLCGAPIVMSTLLNAPAAEKRPLPAHGQVHDRRRPAAGSGAGRHEGGRLRRDPSLRPDGGLRPRGGQRMARGMGRAATGRVCGAEGAPGRALSGARSARRARSGDHAARARPTAQTLGEVMFRGNVVMKGYLKNPAATAKAFEGGWFHSGDLGVKYPDGYIQLKDRSKDIIISGGENISSIEVEDALYKHPAVQAAAVVAMPDEKWGETPLRLRGAEARASGVGGGHHRLVPSSTWRRSNARAR